ncbi:hypothetical protein ACFW6V_16560, partial [Streptomyces sp. NPDC058734]|uniref:hypothetical protein n=1 Tax=Streptomyces sp. NPDC058734 TaxID=3346615 RepID=UPI0036833F57
PPLTVDDGTHADGMYGYRAADLNKVQDLPWGSQLQQSHRWYDIGHWTKSFLWDGLIMDGIVGTVRGLGTLVGADGSAAAGQAWTGLAKLATGIALTTNPGTAFVFWNTDAKAMPAWFRDSRTTMKETGKALVAWDEWNKNPARAAGAVTFNVLTTVFSGGVGTGAKTGALAKTLSVAGKAGRLIDPMTYVGQAAGKAASLTFTKLKIGELLANIGKVDGAFPKVDDVVWNNLPKADAPGVTFPHPNDTARLPDDALGRPQYLDKVTNQLLDHNGRPKQDLTAIPKGTDHPLAEIPTRQHVPVGVGAHTADVTSHTPSGSTTHTPGGGTTHTRAGTADNLPHNNHTQAASNNTTPSRHNTDTAPTGGGVRSTDVPSTGGQGDSPTIPHQGGHGGHDGPSGEPLHDNSPAQSNGHPRDSTGDGTGASDEVTSQQAPSTHPDPVVQRHVDMANSDLEWRRKHYRKNARRLSAEGTDELGNPLSMLRMTGDPARPFTAATEQFINPTYLGPKIPGSVSTVHPDYLEGLHKRTADRSTTIEIDNAAERAKLAAIKEYDNSRTPENELAAKKAVEKYKKTHAAMGDAGENLGEDAAEFHAMRDIDPHAKRLDDRKRGAHRFDQIWQTSGGRYVVIEAKASPSTHLGSRLIPGGTFRAKQGTPQYFDETILQMHARGESALAQKLVIARRDLKLDYIEIRANPVEGRYNGYFKRFFNIGRG